MPATTSNKPTCSGISQKLMNFLSQKSIVRAKRERRLSASPSLKDRPITAVKRRLRPKETGGGLCAYF